MDTMAMFILLWPNKNVKQNMPNLNYIFSLFSSDPLALGIVNKAWTLNHLSPAFATNSLTLDGARV